MAFLTIADLRLDRVLDRRTMRAIAAGYGAPWVFGAFRAYMPPVTALPSVGAIVNNFQVNNTYVHVDQIVNQLTTVAIENSGANSTINAVLLSSLANDGRALRAQP